MVFVADYSHDVLVSFADADNAAPRDGQQGWVSKLVECLNKQLAIQQSGDFSVQASPWQDGPLGDDVKACIRNSATLLVVLSSNYTQSSRQQELEEFLAGVESRTRRDSRVFLLELEKTARADRPPKLYDLRGYRFWNEGQDGRSRTLNASSSSDDGLRYWQELRRLCGDLVSELKLIRSAEKRIARQGEAAEPQRYDDDSFDVFLCHNSEDKDAVEKVGQRLKRKGLRPWLDKWELPPGRKWQPRLEEQIKTVKSAAIFVGPNKIGPWQDEEIDGFVRQFVKRKCPVIPVILEGVGQPPELPVFLEGMTWVDFRAEDPDPIEQLVWGITGEKPDWRPTVFLAEVTDDLYWERVEVAQFLDQEGLHVLPDSTLYSEDPIEFQAALDRDLSRCRLFVQLLSDRSGKESLGMPPDFVATQFRRAKRMRKKILQWRSPNLELATLRDREHEELLTNEYVLAMNLQEFKDRVAEKSLETDDAPSSPRSIPRVHVSPCTNDASITERVQQYLREHRVAYMTAPGDLEFVFAHFHGMLIVYDRENITAVSLLLKDCLQYFFRQPHPPVLAVCKVPPPNGEASLGFWVPDMQIIDGSKGFDASRLQEFVDAVRVTATRVEV